MQFVLRCFGWVTGLYYLASKETGKQKKEWKQTKIDEFIKNNTRSAQSIRAQAILVIF